MTIHSLGQKHGLLAQVRIVSQLRLRVLRQVRTVLRRAVITIQVRHRTVHHGSLHLLVALGHRRVRQILILEEHRLLLALRRGRQRGLQVVPTRVAGHRLARGHRHVQVLLGHQHVQVLPGLRHGHQHVQTVEVAVDQALLQEAAADHRVRAVAVDTAQAGHRAPAQAVAAHRADLVPLQAAALAAAVVVARVQVQALAVADK